MTSKNLLVTSLLTTIIAAWAPAVQSADQTAADGPEPLPEDYSCMVCHNKDGELYAPQTPIVTEKDLANDVHWQRGLRCHDCHGGSPTLDDFQNHRDDPDFRHPENPAEVPAFCGHCHSNIEYMRGFNPSARTDQEAEYWTSGHGHRLKATADDPKTEIDTQVATCVECHGHHGILAIDDPRSPVYPTHVAETCGRCHSDEKRMANRTYRDKPIPHNQFEQWRHSVHGQAMMDRNDTSAATCNDCHGNHGAMPPGVNSVANACGTCHAKVAKLFAQTRMKHQFEKEGLPGCATCHGNHNTVHPSDEFLGMKGNTFCQRCHNQENQQYGATMAGADTAKQMRDLLEGLKTQIAEAEKTVEEAERLGMEVRGPRFDLRQATDALTNARSQVHTFALEPFQEAVGEGTKVVTDVQTRAEAKLQEYTNRRLWLAGSLLPILLVVGLLLAYIRRMPLPSE